MANTWDVIIDDDIILTPSPHCVFFPIDPWVMFFLVQLGKVWRFPGLHSWNCQVQPKIYGVRFVETGSSEVMPRDS